MEYLSETQLAKLSRERKELLSTEQRASWLIDQAGAIQAAAERARIAEEEVQEKRLELARFTALHTVPEVWGLLSREEADEVISCLPHEGGPFGLEPEEGSELSRIWYEKTGIDPGDLAIK